jgi:hypothetical protein
MSPARAALVLILALGAAVPVVPRAWSASIHQLADPPGKGAVPADDAEPGNLLLLDVAVERTVVASAMTAYQIGSGVFVPMGELARVLTLSVRTDPASRRASGFLLRQDRGFDLDLQAGRVVISGRVERVDPSAVRVLEDDIYVDTTLLENWWPVRLRPDRSRLLLTVQPRELLPLQLRIIRESAASLIGRNDTRTLDLPRQDIPYRIFGRPFVDQTLSVNATRSRTDRSRLAASTTYLTGDLFGLEASAYLGASATATASRTTPSRTTTTSQLRMTLGRNDPQGQALGKALPATSFSVGNVLMPGVPHVFRSSAAGPGFTLSNAPLSRATNFSSTSFQGSLPPGWDVELYANDALVGYQQSRADGTYTFADQPLIFGENRFRLVFHGPQGQTRVETRTFNLDASSVRPGELLYTAGAHRDQAGVNRGLLQMEYGLDNRYALYGGMVVAPPQPGVQGRNLVSGGLRAFMDGWMVNSEVVHCLSCTGGGSLYALGVNSRFEYGSLTASHAVLDRFTSEFYPAGPDPVRSSSKGRIDAALPVDESMPLPLTAQIQVDNRRSGVSDVLMSARTTHAWNGSVFTHELAAQQLSGQKSVLGGMQVSRSLPGLSIRGQMLYRIEPEMRVDTGLLSADWNLSNGQLLNLSATHAFQARDTSLAVTLNRNFGSYSLRAGVARSTTGITTAGVQLFTSAGYDPGAQRWMFGSLPSASSGAASARVFLDRNGNGLFDEADEPIPGASFFVNGTTTPVKTDAKGQAFIPRLSPYRNTSVTLNTSSLEDSQWSPAVAGSTFQPRPGSVATLLFPVLVTVEVDGFVYLEAAAPAAGAKGKAAPERRGVSNVQLELRGKDGKAVARVRSTADGYFIFTGVKPGSYLLTVADEQIKRLALEPVKPLKVEVGADGAVANGFDFVLRKARSRS